MGVMGRRGNIPHMGPMGKRMNTNCLKPTTCPHDPLPCAAIIWHPAHDYGRFGLYHCNGITKDAVTAAAMTRKAQRRHDWWHLVDVHKIPVSERAYAANVALWETVDAVIHAAIEGRHEHQ